MLCRRQEAETFWAGVGRRPVPVCKASATATKIAWRAGVVRSLTAFSWSAIGFCLLDRPTAAVALKREPTYVAGPETPTMAERA